MSIMLLACRVLFLQWQLEGYVSPDLLMSAGTLMRDL